MTFFVAGAFWPGNLFCCPPLESHLHLKGEAPNLMFCSGPAISRHSRTVTLLLPCMLCLCCHGLAWGAPFHSNNCNSTVLIQTRVIFTQKEKHKTHTQMLVYNLVGVAFSPCQGTSLVKTLHGHFSNPSLTSGNKLHLLTSHRDPVQSIPAVELK